MVHQSDDLSYEMVVSTDGNEFLSNLENFLDRGPGNDQSFLNDLNTRLTNAVQNEELDFAEKASQLLGTAVGKNRAWQNVYREYAILTAVVRHLGDQSTSLGLAKQYLRVIGNSVADNDANREVVTKDLKSLVGWLEPQELTTTALAVMLNLCNDYDPAQAAAAVLRLDSTIADYLAKDKIAEEAIDYAIDVLTWTTEKLTAVQLKDDTSVNTFNNILKISLQHDEDHYHEYVAILVHYLQDPEFQEKIVTLDTLDRLSDLMIDFEERLTSEEINGAFQELANHKNPENLVHDETAAILMAQLAGYISSVSATDAFVQNFNARSPVVEKLSARLLLPTIPPSSVCTCVMLGNLATSDQACIDMVQNLNLHDIAIKILSSQTEPALLFATAGFVRHLTFPEVNRSILGNAGLIEICCQLLTNIDPSVRGEAAAILGKLVSNNFHNIEKVTHGNLPESITPAQIAGSEAPTEPTILYHITTQALAPSAPLPSMSMKNAMIELARTIIAILRYLSQSHPGEDLDAVVQEIYQTPLIVKPVTRLIRQRFYADARSEGLLGLGLMAQSQDGAALIIKEILEDQGLLGAIKEFAIDQKKEGEGNDATAGRDYQNAVVLLHGLMTNGANAMDPALKDDMDALQTELSKLLV